MNKAINKYKGRFFPKYKDFNILQNNIEEVVKESTQIWNFIYGLTTERAIEQEPKEVGEDKDGQEVVEITKDGSIKDGHEGGIEKEENIDATAEEE